MVGIDFIGIYNTLAKLGFSGLLFFILVGFYRRWWAFGREVEALEKDRDALRADRDLWRDRYFLTLQMAERSTTIASEVAKV